MRQAIQSLLDQDYVRRHGNAAIREVYDDIFEPLIDEDFSIYAVLACGGQTAAAAVSYAAGEGSSPWIFEFGGGTRRKDVQLQVFDLEGLMALRQALMAAAIPAPVVTLHVAQSPFGPSVHHVGAGYKTIQATVPAKDIVDAYGTYRSAIFRYNPRGPQGSNKVNKEIEATLKDENLRGHFHLLNNGLTIVCDSVTYDEGAQTLEVTDFQIVNGCQTAYTLHSLRHELTGAVLIGARLIEGENWAPLIAKSTNSQTAVRPEQLASLGAEHDRIKQGFDALDPSWFYEKQQGSRRFQTPAERQIHRARYDSRVLTIKEVGQFGAAFLGYPILAKYDLKVLFERSEPLGQRLYKAIFGPDSHADQLLLPVLSGRLVQRYVRDRLRALQEESDGSESEAFSELDWLPYARMHLVGLIGEGLRVEAAADVTADRLLSAVESRRRWATLDDWFGGIFERARDAVEFFIEVERRADRLSNLREFFRSVPIYARMEERVRRR